MKNKDLKVGVAALEALLDIGTQDAREALSNELRAVLQFGSGEDKIEAITLIQDRTPIMFLIPALASEEKVNALEKVKLQKKFDLDMVRSALFETATDRRNKLLTCWYALMALAELGDRRNEVAELLIGYAERLIDWLKESEICKSIPGYMLESSIQEETIRALSYFKGNSEVKDVLIEDLYAHRFVGYQQIDPPWDIAIYALSAFGDPSTREYLEYWAEHGDENALKWV